LQPTLVGISRAVVHFTMMASNLVSRLLPTSNAPPSIYETIRQYDEDSDASDVEERAGLILDEENLREPFHELDLQNAHINTSQVSTKSPVSGKKAQEMQGARMKVSRRGSRPRWMKESHKLLDVEEADDDVPASLLIEGGDDDASPKISNLPPPPDFRRDAIPTAGPATNQARQQWQRTQAQQSLHPTRPLPTARRRSLKGLPGLALADPKEKAMWRWANVENLDNFLKDVYDYYLGNGFWSILLQRVLNMLTLAFVVGFTIFLTNCIDYRNVRGSEKMSEILIPRCTSKMGGFANLVLWLVSFFWISKFFQYVFDIRRLRNLHDFYHYLLGISESDIQTISWQEIVSRLMALRDANPATAGGVSAKSRRFLSQNKQRMDAHDIANRLMRKENYLIALFNKDVLDLTLPIPFFRHRQLFSRTLEWNIHQCVIDYVFNPQGQVRPLFLKDTHRKALSDGLRRRFIFAGTLNIFVAPFIVVYFLMHYFFQYFNEYQKNPAQIGSRQYNPLAEWKFREFNELWHLFQRRLNMSYPFATRYLNQFPKDKTVQTARFVSFVAGALASVLALASILDPELFLNFQVTPDRTVLFYLGIFGTIWAVARGLLPEDNLVFDPAFSLEEVIDFTHYRPAHWEDRLHSDQVRAEFAQLYQMKVVIFLNEILSMIFTPFVLWFSLPNCSDQIIDFFREFTVHVDGLGYVCSFAEFNFKRQGNGLQQELPAVNQQQPRSTQETTAQTLREDYYATKDQKLEASYWGFMNDYARNPNTDIRFPYATSRRRRFNPPPPFPGLSPTLPPDMNGHAVYSTGRQDRSTLGLGHRNSPSGALGYQSGTPRFGTAAGHNPASPMASMLLDPHHQPSNSGFHFSSPIARPSKLRHARHATGAAPAEADEGQELADVAEDAGTSQPGTGASGDLGASWKVDRDDDDEEEEDVDAVAGDKGAGGVLGLIRQFQKAQGEGRTGGGGTGGMGL
jgi:autophagy-related protein 9